MYNLCIFILIIPVAVRLGLDDLDFVDAARKAIVSINNGDVKSLRSLYSRHLKATSPEADTEKFLRGSARWRGDIIRVGSPKRIDASTAVFALEAERGDWVLTISLDMEKSIDSLSLLFPPIPVPSKNKTPMSLPFKGRWRVEAGGLNPQDNHHLELSRNARFGIDFACIDENGNDHLGSGRRNEDYFSYGKPVLSAAPGRVVTVVDGFPDNPPGTPDMDNGGNAITIQHSASEFSTYMHLKPHTAAVKPGDDVKAGQMIGLCGNSGRTTEPHIHFHMSNDPLPQLGTGFPVYFRRIKVGHEKQQKESLDHMPITGEVVENLDGPQSSEKKLR